ncbi:hypothetical protein ACFX19_027988 [Malus domestica]
MASLVSMKLSSSFNRRPLSPSLTNRLRTKNDEAVVSQPRGQREEHGVLAAFNPRHAESDRGRYKGSRRESVALFPQCLVHRRPQLLCL